MLLVQSLAFVEIAKSSINQPVEISSALDSDNYIQSNSVLITSNLDADCNKFDTLNRSIIFVAQSTPAPEIPSAFKDLILTNPTSPAAKLIGVDGKNNTTISTPNQFGLEVLNGLDNNGKFNTGIAVDMLPYVLLRGNGLTLEEYKNSELQRFLANTKLSIATTVAGDAARAGLGLEFVLINEGDPRRDDVYKAKVIEIQNNLILKRIRESGGPGKLTMAEKKAILDASDPNIEEAKKEAEKRSGQKPMWTVAFGQSWVSPTTLYSDLRGEGMGFWTTYRLGAGNDSQLLLHASARNGEQIEDKKNKGTFLSTDTIVGGLRYQSGDKDFRFSIETAYNLESRSGQQVNNYLSFGIGLEPRLYDNSWLSLSFGGTSGRENGSDFQLKTGIKWNINPGFVQK
jgi:hypothetical protein